MTAVWSRKHVAQLDGASVDRLPFITDRDVVPVVEGIDIWDSWPIRTPAGSIADVCGNVVWVVLATPFDDDPSLRHDVAELRAVVWHDDGTFVDLGPLFDGTPLGNRQWAGSTLLDGDRVIAYYTAAGLPDASPPGFRQRPAMATATVQCVDDAIRFVGWSEHVEILQPDPARYDTADDADGEPGFIKAFRDPFPFVDPTSGEEYLLFTGSLAPARSATDFNGAIGIARRAGSSGDGWELLDPLVTADGVNNELERPHVVVHADRYYLFFSTQSRTFHPDVAGPTGLYGFVADELLGPYEPLNGHGCVFANPPERPLQVYSWLVLDDLDVIGFIDAFGIDAGGNVISTGASRPTFGGTFSPTMHIWLDGARAGLAGS